MSKHRSIAALVATCALAAPAAAAPGASASVDAAAVPETVLQDDAVFLHTPESEIRASLAQLRELGIDRVRLTAGWSVIAPDPDSTTAPSVDLSDPAAYPKDAWYNLDRAVRLVHEAGLRSMIDIAFWAPRWATRSEASETDRLRTEVDPAAFATFSAAVARRYAGGYRPPAPAAPAAKPAPKRSPDQQFLDSVFGRPAPPPPAEPEGKAPEPLPAVDIFTIWNEPNHPGFLMPQWTVENGQPVPRSPHLYRQMVAAAHPVIKAAAPNSTVLIGGTASMGGGKPGAGGVPPLRFLRELACVDEQLRPRTDGPCADFRPVPGDGWSHHPYSLRIEPEAVTRDPDQLPVAATPRLLKTLRALVQQGRLAPGVESLYQTEYGYETNAPDPEAPFSLEIQGELLARAERIGTADPRVRMWPQFLLRDRPGGRAGPRMREFGDWQSGLLREDGTPKPAYATFRAPAVASCVQHRGTVRVEVWARLRGGPAGAQARVQTSVGPNRWRTLAVAASARAPRMRSLAATSAAPGAPVIRYVRAAPERQLRVDWRDSSGGAWQSAALRPTGCAKATAAAARYKRRPATKRGKTPQKRGVRRAARAGR